ncbi:MAG: MFS transporter [Hyphomonadaceae bacterium]
MLLCTIYVMAPYISTVVIGDPVRGQAIISGWHKTSGIIIALTAPFLGAASDRMGRRKPLLGAAVLMLAGATLAQYWALPAGEGGLPLWLIGAAVTFAGVMFVYTEVFHNSMLVRAAHPEVLHHVSGLGLSLGNLSSVLLLVFVLVGVALPGQVHWPFVLDAPLFGLDPAKHEPSRVVALISAGWLLVFSVPLFLYTPDLDTTGEKFGNALRHGAGNVLRTLRKLSHYRNVALFLFARMLYADGKTAILIFSGVYAAGVMSWGLIEMLALGATLTLFAVLGGFAGGWLDHHVGPKRAVIVELVMALTSLIAMVSMAPGRMFFVLPVDADAHVWNGPVFQTAPELAYVGVAIFAAISITAAYASSRTLMARLAPKGMEGELFGLYALSGSATAWLGPLLVEIFTSAYHSQRAGFASVAILLVAGLALLLFVRPPPANGAPQAHR